MKKMGKWLLSLMVAVSLTMPVLADVNVQSTGTEFASEIGAAELQAGEEKTERKSFFRKTEQERWTRKN
mgnify:CR=1 FL=1